MEQIIQRARILISCISGGCSAFLLLGYLAKAIPAFAVGVAFIIAAINLFGVYLFFFYPDLREEIMIGIATEVLGGILLWM